MSSLSSAVKRKFSVGRMGFGPTYVAHIPPIVVWHSRDLLCYGVGACMAYITAKAKAKVVLFGATEIRNRNPKTKTPPP